MTNLEEQRQSDPDAPEPPTPIEPEPVEPIEPEPVEDDDE